ncbi:SGNH/GDSL hydrolase family protein [Streptomyces sp. NPDC052396]|uniref:SGNH/GDSL hydrolase family protein n=1 Tax=Streptomyces sp. NPDC052396 TaxID=3365689 RepID=UPI0037CD40F1
MRRTSWWRRRLLAALVCPVSLASVAVASPAHAGSTVARTGHEVRYVALGDSVASGLGAGDYEVTSGRCTRSTNAYPALWAAEHHLAGPGFVFVACSGATTSDIVSTQLSRLDGSVTMVSVTVGANDVGFADVLTECGLDGERACLEHVRQARDDIDHKLPGRLDGLDRAIREKAPQARVVVLGYPHLFAEETCDGQLVSRRGQAALNDAADRLNAVTRHSAQAHGFVFADVTHAFTGHELCSSDPWIIAPSLFTPVSAYHPDATGQREGYLPALEAAAGGGS